MRAWARSRPSCPFDLQTYVEDAQHDAWLMGHSREGDRITLTASDEHTIFLAEWGFGIPWRECLFPFDMIFERVQYLGWRLIREDSTLTWSPPPKIEPDGRPEILYDTLLDSEGSGIRWAMESGGWDMHHRLLLIEARDLRIVLRQRAAWLQWIGTESLPLYDAFDARRKEISLNFEEMRTPFLLEHGIKLRFL